MKIVFSKKEGMEILKIFDVFGQELQVISKKMDLILKEMEKDG